LGTCKKELEKKISAPHFRMLELLPILHDFLVGTRTVLRTSKENPPEIIRYDPGQVEKAPKLFPGIGVNNSNQSGKISLCCAAH